MAENKCTSLLTISFIVVMATLISVIETTKSSYWQTFVRDQASKLKEKHNKLCFPTQTSTRENLGRIVTKNVTTLCIENTLVIGKFNKVGWNADFETSKSVMSVEITSSYSQLMANMLTNFVIFVSTTPLEYTKDYRHFPKQAQECARYKGQGFKANEQMSFKCCQRVYGRYFYVWGLDRSRIQSTFIHKIRLEFAIELLENPSVDIESETIIHSKDHSIFFKYFSGWGEIESKGFWMVKFGRTYRVNTVLIGVHPKVIKSLGSMIIDVGTVDSNGRGLYSGEKRSEMSANGKSYLVRVNLKGNSIRIRGSIREGYLSEDSVTFMEMMCLSGTSTLYFKDEVKLNKRKFFHTATKKINPKGNLQIWQDASLEVTGWLMIDLGNRYVVKGVSILSGSDAHIVLDLQGLVIATSNFIPYKILSNEDKLEADTCGVVGGAIKVVPNKTNFMKCMPEPSLGAFVLFYNKEKPLRLSAIKAVSVYVQMDKYYKFEFKLPYFPRIPPKPPQTSLHLIPFFVQTDFTTGPYGYWVVDLLMGRKVSAVVITAGSASNTFKTFTIYVQDFFSEDLFEVCARFMCEKFPPKKIKFLLCTPTPKSGRYVILSSQLQSLPTDAIRNIEVRFYRNKRLEQGAPNMPTKTPPESKPDKNMQAAIDWNIIYNNIRFSQRPKGWWFIDFGKKHVVAEVSLILNSDLNILREFMNVYVGLSNKLKDEKGQICAYHSNNMQISKQQAAHYSLVCSSPYQYRYAIIRAKMECDKFPLEIIQSIKVVVKNANSYQHAILDVSEISKQLPLAQKAWKKIIPAVQLHSDSGKFVYSFDFKMSVDVAMLEINVKSNTQVKTISVLLNNNKSCKRAFKTCFRHDSTTTQTFYAGSQYKLRCSYRGTAQRYVFFVAEQKYLKSVKFTIKSSNQYYYYIWTGIIEAKCLVGYKLISGICYKPVTKRMYFKEAQQNCLDSGGYLATIQNQVQYLAAVKAFQKVYHRCYLSKYMYQHRYWLGGVRFNGEFMWLTRESPSNFTPNQRNPVKGAFKTSWMKWAVAQPDNGGGVENCVEMVLLTNWGMNDEPCRGVKFCSLCQAIPM